MSHTRAAVILASLGALGLAGCGTVTKTLGLTSPAPDEFRVVTKAPLVIPPEYALRPPAPGSSAPTDLKPQIEAQTALLGAQREVAARSVGENLLVQKAGGDKADPGVRYQVDDENGELAHKDKSFADLVLNWKPGSAPTSTAMPVNAAAEDARLKSLTGGQTVIIARQRTSGFKLPGL